ncbi:succinate-semialdehyde dehydrogenase/glutarate-semialdehyde dehydrogenase [Amorphus suaedae]
MSGVHDRLGHFIDGKWIVGAFRETLPVLNPATGEEIARVPVAETEHLDAALAAAERGFEVWRRTLPLQRGAVVRRIASLIRERADEIAATMTREQGKPLAEARGEAMAAAELVDWLAEEARRVYGRIVPSRLENSRVLVTREPVGPVAAFTPWNFPCMMPARKIAHALAAGCSVIVKPAEETPGTAVLLGEICKDAGVPDGVVGIVFGHPAKVSEYLIASPVVKKISLTGSVPVGKTIAALAARDLKRVTLELGGHSPVIVFDDADVERAAKLCVAGRFRNAGQVCTAPTRFFVQEKVADRFTELFTAATRAIVVGDGSDPSSQMGPLANSRRLEAMDRLVADAEARGGRVTVGGTRIGNRGFFFAPTVIEDIPGDAELMRTEPFGPLAPIRRFESADAVLREANSVPYGLAGYAFTGSQKTAAQVSDGLHVGVLAINGVTVTAPEAPFGGVGESGIGRESGLEGLLEYTEIKTVTETFV